MKSLTTRAFFIIFGFALAVVADATVLKMIGLTLVIVGNLSMYGPFWAVPSVYLSEQAAAVGIAWTEVEPVGLLQFGSRL